MNCVILMGRLVRDAEVRTSKDMTIAKFTLAVDRRAKSENGQSADFITCTAFKKSAEFIEKYVRKGTKVVVQGRWQTGSYDNKEGQKVYTNDCIIDSIEFAESKKASESAPKSEDDNFMNLPEDIDEEVPFG